jgi:pimeloyl-ACP methyl ester carboxylesterase
MNIFSSAANIIARLLPHNLREPVMGDLAESGATPLGSVLALLDIVVRKQVDLWRDWNPWLAGAISSSGSLLLLGASFSLSMNLRPILSGSSSHTSEFLLLQALLLVLWAWTAGFVVGSLSLPTAWASAALCITPCISCTVRFQEPSLSRFCVLIFLAPALLGAISGMRLRNLHLRTALPLALATTALMFSFTGMSMWNWLLLAPSWLMVATAHNNINPRTFPPRRTIALITTLLVLFTIPASAADSTSKLVTREIHSACFTNSKIGVDPTRKLVVYLPAGYDSSAQRYPVVYFFPSPFDSSFRAIFDERNAQSVLDRAINDGAIHKFLFVTVDMTTPLGSSWYVNSSATGNWEDFVIKELVPYIDQNFRTLPTRDSRGIAGHFMGGYGAIRLAMEHPETFGSVYALHPVGTGSGVKILAGIPNWDLMQNAKTLDDVRRDGYSKIFVSIFEAHVPNPNTPPLYIDFPAQRVNGQLVIDAHVMERLRNNFFLESLIGKYASNLKSLRAFKFDWARSDSNWDHVYSNQAFTHKLNEYGIPHEAEEYNGTWDSDPNWGPEGRITTDLLPFFQSHLAF